MDPCDYSFSSSLSGYWWYAGFPIVPQVPKVTLGSWWVASFFFPIPQVPQVTYGSLYLLWFL